LFLINLSLSGQDKIYLTSKNVLNVKVLLATDTIIKYQYKNNLNEPPLILDAKLVRKFFYENGKLRRYKSILVEPKDSINYFHAGVIPYQFFTRSFGAYTGFTFKKFGIEYRLSYTIPTKYTWRFFNIYDWFYYQGINNFLLFSYSPKKNNVFSLMLGYRNWWYTNKFVPIEGTSILSGGPYSQLRSSEMHGFINGFEYSRNYSWRKLELAIIANAALTSFFDYAIYKTTVHIGIGFKVGFNKQIKNTSKIKK